MTKILVICGPTGVGKTNLGIHLAEKYNGEIISADSRQVYKGMDIGTGKETSDKVVIWGYDLVAPTEEFSVAHFRLFAQEKIKDIVRRGKLPILVGGTGFYIKAVLEPLETLSVPRNQILRDELTNKSAEELFTQLFELAPAKAQRMNNSDRKNPARLIRAIEVALSGEDHQKVESETFNSLLIGLSSAEKNLEERLHHSIEKRLNQGFEDEVRNLLKAPTAMTAAAISATGYREMGEFINKQISKEALVQNWFQSERQYIKRQLTWFKKQKNIHWIDIESADYINEVEELVKTWHNIS